MRRPSACGSPWRGHVMLAYTAIGHVAFYAFIRSRYSRRIGNASLLLSQIVLAVSATDLAYAMGGEARAALIVIFAMHLMFTMLILQPRQTVQIGTGTMLSLLLTSAAMAWLEPDRFPWRMELLHMGTLLEDAISVKGPARGGLTIALLDIDHFKRINGTLGHQAGDAVLRHFARVLQQNVRGADVPARRGGEEFLLLFPDTPGNNALAALERVRSQLLAAPRRARADPTRAPPSRPAWPNACPASRWTSCWSVPTTRSTPPRNRAATAAFWPIRPLLREIQQRRSRPRSARPGTEVRAELGAQALGLLGPHVALDRGHQPRRQRAQFRHRVAAFDLQHHAVALQQAEVTGRQLREPLRQAGEIPAVGGRHRCLGHDSRGGGRLQDRLLGCCNGNGGQLDLHFEHRRLVQAGPRRDESQCQQPLQVLRRRAAHHLHPLLGRLRRLEDQQQRARGARQLE
ncbi:MAG: GGDEF domain-containing protein, partial [Aquabacterium sp.]